MLLILRSKKRILKKVKKFNELISHHLKNAGVDFSFASFEDIEIFMETGKINLLIDDKPLQNWKTIYPRKVGEYRILAFILANLSKKNKLIFIDRFLENSSSTTKIVQMFQFAQNKIPIPKTYYTTTYSRKQLSSAVKFLGLPVVIKKCNTSQGSGVFLAKTVSELNKSIKALLKSKNNGSIFLQEFIPNDFEYRIFVTGNKIGAAEKKIRTKAGEFRNNVHLGAREEFVKISDVKKNILKIALKASHISNIQVSGVDIVEANGRIVVFEANSCPGLTFDEKISPELKSLANYLEECEKK
ncbi:MAG: ATP-grasp domain-containing protein [Candidatus Moraniibacteriota bacterium]